jgi:hypothetical protein
MYIDDCTDGTIRLAASDIIEPLNIGSDELVSINRLVDIVEKIAGVKLKRSYKLDAPKGVRGRNSDNTLIKKLMNWAPSIRLEDGMEKTYKWIHDEMTSGKASVVNALPRAGARRRQYASASDQRAPRADLLAPDAADSLLLFSSPSKYSIVFFRPCSSDLGLPLELVARQRDVGAALQRIVDRQRPAMHSFDLPPTSFDHPLGEMLDRHLDRIAEIDRPVKSSGV